MHHFKAYNFVNTQELPRASPHDPHRGFAPGPHQRPKAGPWTPRRWRGVSLSLGTGTVSASFGILPKSPYFQRSNPSPDRDRNHVQSL